MADVFKNDVGTVLEATILDSAGAVIDVSTATTKTLKLVKPSGAVLNKTATFTTDGSDGKIRYATIANDLDSVGTWRIQAYIELGASNKFHTSVTTFEVVGTY